MKWGWRWRNGRRSQDRDEPDLRFRGALKYGTVKPGDDFYVLGVLFEDGRKHVVRCDERDPLRQHLRKLLNCQSGEPVAANVMIWLPRNESWTASVALSGPIAEVRWLD